MKDLGKRMFECMEQYISRKYSEPLAKELIQEFYKVGEVGNFNHISGQRQTVLFEAMDYAKKELPYCPYEIIVEENKGGIGLYRLRLVDISKAVPEDAVKPFECEEATLRDMLIHGAELVGIVKENLEGEQWYVDYRILKINVPLEQYKDIDPSINQMISEGIIQKKFAGFKMYFPNGIN